MASCQSNGLSLLKCNFFPMTNQTYLINKAFIIILVFFDKWRTAGINEAVRAPLRSCPPLTDGRGYNGIELVTAPKPELDSVTNFQIVAIDVEPISLNDKNKFLIKFWATSEIPVELFFNLREEIWPTTHGNDRRFGIGNQIKTLNLNSEIVSDKLSLSPKLHFPKI